MRYLIILFALAGCGGTVVQDRPTVVRIAVTVPCVSGERPAAVISLKEQYPNWQDKTPKQKAELVAAQALKRKTYGQEINNATSACK